MLSERDRNFSNYIRTTREKLKLTQTEFGEGVGLTLNTIANYERGKFIPKLPKQMLLKNTIEKVYPEVRSG